jgi:hypothetical protein
MARIQHSIEINVPVRTLYDQLTQFKEYPAFWENIVEVEQVDDTHLHWTAKSVHGLMQYDTEIVGQKPDCFIEWHDSNGSSVTGRVQVHKLTPHSSKADVTLDVEPEKFSGLAGGGGQEKMQKCLIQSLGNLKIFLETLELETGAWRGEIEEGHVTVRGRDAKEQLKQTAGQRSPASFSGSPTEVLDDESDEAGFGADFKDSSPNKPSPGKSERGVAR